MCMILQTGYNGHGPSSPLHPSGPDHHIIHTCDGARGCIHITYKLALQVPANYFKKSMHVACI